jgi:hypothetical protein
MDRGGISMSSYSISRQSLLSEELATEPIEVLPDRAAMSLVNANLAIPVNLALAANVLSDNATAAALAQQTAPIGQGI